MAGGSSDSPKIGLQVPTHSQSQRVTHITLRTHYFKHNIRQVLIIEIGPIIVFVLSPHVPSTVGLLIQTGLL